MRLLSKCRRAACVLPLLATLGCDAAHAADNIVPVEVRQLLQGDSFNRLFVDVMVCHDAQHCRSVPNVLVDTGSAGLRLFRPALYALSLDPVTDLVGHALGNWARFGAGDLWGTLHWAQVRIGGLATTAAIPIGLYDLPAPHERLPAGYGDRDLRGTMLGNGILGIAPWRHSMAFHFAFVGARGAASAADWMPVQVERSQALANPIGYFPEPYDNGSVISLPEVDWFQGQSRVQGWLGFGLGPPTDMLFPRGHRVIVHELDDHGQFRATVGDRPIDLMLDSGSNMLSLDLEALGVARHPWFPGLYEAATLTPIDMAVQCAEQEIKLVQRLYVGSADNLGHTLRGHAVLPMVAAWPVQQAGKEAKNLLGLPFFYGRSVATGLEGAINPYLEPAPASVPRLTGDAGAAPARYGFVAYTD